MATENDVGTHSLINALNAYRIDCARLFPQIRPLCELIGVSLTARRESGP